MQIATFRNIKYTGHLSHPGGGGGGSLPDFVAAAVNVYASTSVSITSNDGVATYISDVNESGVVPVTITAQVHNLYGNPKLTWNDVHVKVMIKSNPSDDYSEASTSDYDWVTGSGISLKNLGTGYSKHRNPVKVKNEIKFTEPGYYKIIAIADFSTSSPNEGSDSSDTPHNDSVSDDNGFYNITAHYVRIKPIKDTQRNPALGKGVLCLNAINNNPKYDYAKWEATVLPKGTKATVSVDTDNSVADDINVQNRSNVSNGDTVKVTGGSTPGNYYLTIKADNTNHADNVDHKGDNTGDNLNANGVAFEFKKQYLGWENISNSHKSAGYLDAKATQNTVSAEAFHQGSTSSIPLKQITIGGFNTVKVITEPQGSYNGKIKAEITAKAEQRGILVTRGYLGIGGINISGSQLTWKGQLSISGAGISPIMKSGPNIYECHAPVGTEVQKYMVIDAIHKLDTTRTLNINQDIKAKILVTLSGTGTGAGLGVECGLITTFEVSGFSSMLEKYLPLESTEPVIFKNFKIVSQ